MLDEIQAIIVAHPIIGLCITFPIIVLGLAVLLLPDEED